MSFLRWSIVFLAGILVLSCGNNSPKPHQITGDEDHGGLILPENFSALVVAEGVGKGRHMDVNQNGDIYISLQYRDDGRGMACLRDTTGDGKADIIEYAGQLTGTGIKLYNDYVYFGADTMIVRYRLPQDQLVPDEEFEVIAKGFSKNNQHGAKPFEFDRSGNMYVNVGAPSNACMEQSRTMGSPGMDPCPLLDYSGGVWKFNADRPNQDQRTDGIRYATGIRNGVANAWNPVVNKLYVVQHGRDQLSQFFPDYYDSKQNAELPAEEFFLVEEGSDFGWPYCYYDQFKELKVLAPEYGGDGSLVDRCAEKEDPIMAFPGHVAPNDIVFYQGDMFPERYKNGAFIAFHGSWNRAPEPQEGFYVVFVPFDGAYPSGDWEVFADGFSGIEQVNNPRDAKHRPCGLAVGPDGSLYVVDSVKGKVWRIIYKG